MDISAKNFLISVCIFSIYLVAKWFRYIHGFRDYIDKLFIVLIAAFGYYTKVKLPWIIAFFIIFMVFIISQPFDMDSRTGSSIKIIHEYDSNPRKKEEQLKRAIIPLRIYQTWHNKQLPPKMKQCVDRLKQMNPEFSHHLFDDKESRDYIEKHFDRDVLNAYDRLIPGAYKADLWRYCVLYKEGGIYMDIKLQCEPHFKLLELVDKEHFVMDRPYIKSIPLDEELAWLQSPGYTNSAYLNADTNIWENGEIGLYNAFMVCKANNPILKECIDAIVQNTKKKYYGYCPLYPTGPGLLGKLYFHGNREKIHTIDLYNSLNGDCILTRNKKIITHYKDYRDEQKRYGKGEYYHNLWKKNMIYAD